MITKGGNIIRFLNLLKSKILISIVIISLIASTICVTGSLNFSQNVFTPRLSAPLRNNTCYYSSNIFFSSGYGMPNCTAYAWGRAYEILRKRPQLSLGDAGGWYQYNKENNIYDYGKSPKVGAIACFDNAYGGHVAVVEKIEGGKITFSNSAYMGRNFYLSYADTNEENPGQEDWVFQGYIYLLNGCDKTCSINAVRRVVCDSGLNLRSCMGINSNVIKVIPKGEQIFISNVYFLDGYSWGETSYDGKFGYCVIDFTESLM